VETRYSKIVSLGGAGAVIWNPKLTELPTTPVPRADRKILETVGTEFSRNWSKSNPPNEHEPILRTFVFKTVVQSTVEAFTRVEQPRIAVVSQASFTLASFF
jgi:hypothetical protein